MDLHEALYTTRAMRRMTTDPVPLDVQGRILDAALRAPNGGNVQNWHFLVVDDAGVKKKLRDLYVECQKQEAAEVEKNWHVDTASEQEAAARAEDVRRIRKSGDRLGEKLDEVPMLLVALSKDPHGGANIYPAVWSAMLAARGEGVGSVLTTMLRYEADTALELIGVPPGEGWQMICMLALGYPLGRWGVAANRRPVHEVASRNRFGEPFGMEIPDPLWGTVPDARP